MTDLYATARAMIADLKAKKISARELLDAHLARNDALHPKLNAVIRTDIARAQKDALAIDGGPLRIRLPSTDVPVPQHLRPQRRAVLDRPGPE